MNSDEVLSRYIEACTATVFDYIKRSTRFGISDVKVMQATPSMQMFNVNVRHVLDVASGVEARKGRHFPGQDDCGSTDLADYKRQIAEQEEAEFKRAETLDLLAQSVREHEYAGIVSRMLIRTHPRKLFHTYSCESCHGAGKVVCLDCVGNGKVQCRECTGNGRFRCRTCSGSGRITKTILVSDDNDGGMQKEETQQFPCPDCSDGYVKCTGCQGLGKTFCRACGAAGKIMCLVCSGQGEMTRITTTQTYTTPSFSATYHSAVPGYVPSAVNKAGPANLGQYGSLRFSTSSIDYDHSVAEFIYQCTLPFCDMQVVIKGKSSVWVLFGNSVQIFDSHGALQALMQEDFARLGALLASGKSRSPRFYQSAEKVIGLYMQSDLHQEVIDASLRGLEPNAIAEYVKRSLSESYIAESLQQLSKIIRTASNWSSVMGSAVIGILSVPVVFTVTLIIEHSEPHVISSADQKLYIFPDPESNVWWSAGVIAVPAACLLWYFAKQISNRWLLRAGGNSLLRWAEQKQLLMGTMSAMASIIASLIIAVCFFSLLPIWIDSKGAVYGGPMLFEPPQLQAPPQAPVVPQTKVVQPVVSSVPETNTSAPSAPASSAPPSHRRNGKSRASHHADN